MNSHQTPAKEPTEKQQKTESVGEEKHYVHNEDDAEKSPELILISLDGMLEEIKGLKEIIREAVEILNKSRTTNNCKFLKKKRLTRGARSNFNVQEEKNNEELNRQVTEPKIESEKAEIESASNNKEEKFKFLHVLEDILKIKPVKNFLQEKRIESLQVRVKDFEQEKKINMIREKVSEIEDLKKRVNHLSIELERAKSVNSNNNQTISMEKRAAKVALEQRDMLQSRHIALKKEYDDLKLKADSFRTSLTNQINLNARLNQSIEYYMHICEEKQLENEKLRALIPSVQANLQDNNLVKLKPTSKFNSHDMLVKYMQEIINTMTGYNKMLKAEIYKLISELENSRANQCPHSADILVQQGKKIKEMREQNACLITKNTMLKDIVLRQAKIYKKLEAEHEQNKKEYAAFNKEEKQKVNQPSQTESTDLNEENYDFESINDKLSSPLDGASKCENCKSMQDEVNKYTKNVKKAQTNRNCYEELTSSHQEQLPSECKDLFESIEPSWDNSENELSEAAVPFEKTAELKESLTTEFKKAKTEIETLNGIVSYLTNELAQAKANAFKHFETEITDLKREIKRRAKMNIELKQALDTSKCEKKCETMKNQVAKLEADVKDARANIYKLCDNNRGILKNSLRHIEKLNAKIAENQALRFQVKELTKKNAKFEEAAKLGKSKSPKLPIARNESTENSEVPAMNSKYDLLSEVGQSFKISYRKLMHEEKSKSSAKADEKLFGEDMKKLKIQFDILVNEIYSKKNNVDFNSKPYKEIEGHMHEFGEIHNVLVFNFPPYDMNIFCQHMKKLKENFEKVINFAYVRLCTEQNSTCNTESAPAGNQNISTSNTSSQLSQTEELVESKNKDDEMKNMTEQVAMLQKEINALKEKNDQLSCALKIVKEKSPSEIACEQKCERMRDEIAYLKSEIKNLLEVLNSPPPAEFTSQLDDILPPRSLIPEKKIDNLVKDSWTQTSSEVDDEVMPKPQIKPDMASNKFSEKVEEEEEEEAKANCDKTFWNSGIDSDKILDKQKYETNLCNSETTFEPELDETLRAHTDKLAKLIKPNVALEEKKIINLGKNLKKRLTKMAQLEKIKKSAKLPIIKQRAFMQTLVNELKGNSNDLQSLDQALAEKIALEESPLKTLKEKLAKLKEKKWSESNSSSNREHKSEVMDNFSKKLAKIRKQSEDENARLLGEQKALKALIKLIKKLEKQSNKTNKSPKQPVVEGEGLLISSVFNQREQDEVEFPQLHTTEQSSILIKVNTDAKNKDLDKTVNSQSYETLTQNSEVETNFPSSNIIGQLVKEKYENFQNPEIEKTDETNSSSSSENTSHFEDNFDDAIEWPKELEDEAQTQCVYFVDDDTRQYMVIINKPKSEVTLSDFKSAVHSRAPLLNASPGLRYVYIFKSIDEEFGFYKREISKDSNLLLLLKDRVVAWIETRCLFI